MGTYQITLISSLTEVQGGGMTSGWLGSDKTDTTHPMEVRDYGDKETNMVREPRGWTRTQMEHSLIWERLISVH